MTDHAHWEDIVADEQTTISPRFTPGHPDHIVLDVNTERRGAIILGAGRCEIHVPVDELEQLIKQLRILLAVARASSPGIRTIDVDEDALTPPQHRHEDWMDRR